MAIQLTSSFQKVAEVSYQVTSNTTGYARLYLKYRDRNISALTDIVDYEIRQYSYNPYGNYLGWGNTSSVPWHIKSTNGKVYASGTYTQPNIYSNSGEVVRAFGNFTITHNDDGSWSDTINFLAYVYTASLNVNVDISSPTIDRLATITDYPTSLTDLDDTITFSYFNPANFQVQPQLMITQGNSIGYEHDGYITENPFSWKWLSTSTDKERLYSVVRTSTKATVSLRLKTYNNNDELLGITAVEIPFELVDADPFVELETEEQNQRVIDVVGEQLIAVNYVSRIKSTATFLPTKDGVLKKISINGVESDTSPFTTTIKVETELPSTIFGVIASVEDTRTLTAGAEKIYQLVDYRPVNINSYKFKRENPTSDKIYLNADIRYWNVNVNGILNKVTISYSIDGETYTDIPKSDYTIDSENKKITITNYEIPDTLNYRDQGTYYLRVEDNFTSDEENELVTKGIPTMEKGKTVVQVNGDLILADEDRNNPLNIRDLLNQTGDTLPIGSMIPYGNIDAPTNWLRCDGSEVSREKYAELFEAIGTTYGVGDGSTTFNLPDLKGRVPVGLDEYDSDGYFDELGKKFGSKYLQEHKHPIASFGSTTLMNAGSNYGTYIGDGNRSTENAGTGNGQNIQPSLVVNYIIKAYQSAGVVANVSQDVNESTQDVPSCKAVKDYIARNGGGSGGTSDYEYLDNQPKINGVTLIGNKTSNQLKLQPAGDYALTSDIPTKTSQLTNDSGYLTSIPSEYVTETELDKKGFLTEHQDLTNYATKTYVTDQIASAIGSALGGSY